MRAKPECFPRAARTEHRSELASEGAEQLARVSRSRWAFPASGHGGPRALPFRFRLRAVAKRFRLRASGSLPKDTSARSGQGQCQEFPFRFRPGGAPKDRRNADPRFATNAQLSFPEPAMEGRRLPRPSIAANVFECAKLPKAICPQHGAIRRLYLSFPRRIRANGKNGAKRNDSVRVPGPSTVAERSAAEGGAHICCYATFAPCRFSAACRRALIDGFELANSAVVRFR